MDELILAVAVVFFVGLLLGYWLRGEVEEID